MKYFGIFILFSIQAFAVDSTYKFNIKSYDYWSSNPSCAGQGNMQNEYEMQGQVQVQENGNDISFDRLLFTSFVCNQSYVGFPIGISVPVGSANSYELGGDSLSKITGAHLTVSIEAYDSTKGELEFTSACSWNYACGGSGISIQKFKGEKVFPQ